MEKISRKTRNAVMILAELSQHNQPLPIVKFAIYNLLSQSLIEQMMRAMGAAGLVRGNRGRRGGYQLNKSPDEISLLEIAQAVEHVDDAPESLTWNVFCSQLDAFLSQTKLGDLVRIALEQKLE